MKMTNFVAKHRKAVSFISAVAMSATMGTAVLAGNNAPANSNITDFGLEAARPTSYASDQTLQETIASIINVALGLLGVIALVIILAGGFEWMTAGGNEEKTTEARKRIIAGVIGLAIILSAYAIAQFVLRSLSTATGTGAGNAI
jgi:hypothetical protein